jgi:hypothetical protein
VIFDLPPMNSAAGAVLNAVADGDLTPAEGAHIMALVETYRRTLETSSLEARMLAPEVGSIHGEQGWSGDWVPQEALIASSSSGN